MNDGFEKEVVLEKGFYRPILPYQSSFVHREPALVFDRSVTTTIVYELKGTVRMIVTE